MTRRAGTRLAGALVLATLTIGGTALQPAPAHAASAAPRPAQASQGCDVGQRVLVPEESYVVDRLGLESAWEVTRGDGVVVAVVDSGVQARNAHFASALTEGTTTFSGGDAGADVYGHGTLVAGLIAARRVEGSGAVGVAPEAQIMPVRVYEADADTAEREGLAAPSADGIASGIRWAADHGADIINVSLSMGDADPALVSAVEHARSQGALVVASAGNRKTADAENPPTEFYPAQLPGVLAVSGVTSDGEWDASSSFRGEHVDVVAPGQSMLSAFISGGDCVVNTESPSSSYATALVSGVAALVAAAHPEEGPDEWAFRIMASAQRSDPRSRADTTGWGEVRPFEALNLVDDGTLAGPASPLHGPAPETSTAPDPIGLDIPADPADPARAAVGWALLIGGAASLIALLVGRLGDVRRRASRSR
ncbi:S8 family serine peptidase [Microbacterium marinilacus]|uniref:Type VII secretion-associated serine protease mycosin n=1 Tax=Microbacterium marinilacus TaxID=415209 RepID=A0ABP7BHH8_9MICO|nr:S8 family serine peptidase [Microbacterium marinilacus]MBY0689508.1 S8 family serine peptidase [Microbacterium marinilacus]